jgi:hypothetical protein
VDAAVGAYPSDEQILGIDPPSPKGGFGGLAREDDGGVLSGGESARADRNTFVAEAGTDAGADAADSFRTGDLSDGKSHPGADGMPVWMQSAAGDPQHSAEAQALWSEHQAFRAAFSSPEEARAIKELFPGGAHEAQSLKQSAQSVERIDAAIFSGDARAQSEVVAEIARANPAAFRSLFAEAAKVLAGMGVSVAPGAQSSSNFQAFDTRSLGPTLRQTREGWGTQNPSQQTLTQNNSSQQSPVTDRTVTNHPPSPESGFGGLRPSDHPSQLGASQSPNFDPAAYASFERSTNDVVARDVRGSISDTLSRVLPEGVADGAARRIGEDIFNEVHRALAADRSLSEQVGEVLRERRFGSGEQQRVAALLAGRAKQLVPGVARRVIGEWTSSVLGTARTKAARQAAAAARVDIAAPGGSLDSMPLRAMSGREVNYASMSDDEILGM